jgi:hypothetical protein
VDGGRSGGSWPIKQCLRMRFGADGPISQVGAAGPHASAARFSMAPAFASFSHAGMRSRACKFLRKVSKIEQIGLGPVGIALY